MLFRGKSTLKILEGLLLVWKSFLSLCQVNVQLEREIYQIISCFHDTLSLRVFSDSFRWRDQFRGNLSFAFLRGWLHVDDFCIALHFGYCHVELFQSSTQACNITVQARYFIYQQVFHVIQHLLGNFAPWWPLWLIHWSLSLRNIFMHQPFNLFLNFFLVDIEVIFKGFNLAFNFFNLRVEIFFIVCCPFWNNFEISLYKTKVFCCVFCELLQSY